MKISLIKANGLLFPVGEEATDNFNRLENGKEFVFSVTMHRNPKFHRMAFALLNTIYENQDGFTNRKLFRNWITMKAGYVITGTAPNGVALFMAESLSFESMKQDVFEQWYSDIINVAIQEYGHDEKTLEQIMHFA